MESIHRSSQHPSFPESPGSAPLPERPAPTPVREEGNGANVVETFIAQAPPRPDRRPTEERLCRADPTMTAGTLAFTGRARAKPPRPFLRSDGKPFPVSRDGTPLYKQNDRSVGGNWGATKLGNGPNPSSIGREGCALTSVAMALSKLTGQTLTPAMLDAHLDAQGGYAKDRQGQETNGLLWRVAGQAVQPPVTVTRLKQWDPEALDAALEAGRPVVLGVDYRKDAKTDHWVCITRRDAEDPALYHANDPATGREIHLRKDAEGRLVQVQGEGGKPLAAPYRSSGEFVTFKPR